MFKKLRVERPILGILVDGLLSDIRDLITPEEKKIEAENPSYGYIRLCFNGKCGNCGGRIIKRTETTAMEDEVNGICLSCDYKFSFSYTLDFKSILNPHEVEITSGKGSFKCTTLEVIN